MPSNRLVAALTGLALSLVHIPAVAAAPTDYAFEAVRAEVKNAPDAELAVRLVHKPNARPVEGAVLFRSRLDMSPEGMAEHTAAVSPLPSTEPGVYRFKAELSMAGAWALRLMAKVPGETGTVEGSVIFKAKD